MLSWCDGRGSDPRQLTAGILSLWSETIPETYSSRKMARFAARSLLESMGADPDLAAAIRVPRRRAMTCRALDHDASVRLRDAAQIVGGRQGLATLAALYTGARTLGVARMRWEGITLTEIDDGAKLGGVIEFERAKAGGLARLPLHPVLAAQLDAWPWPHRVGYLFTGGAGRPHVDPRTIGVWIQQVAHTAGITMTAHQLRHTALQRIVDGTRDLRAAQEVAGHRSPDITAAYTMATWDRLVEAIMSIE